MSKEFTKLSEVPVVEKVSENAKVLIEENGEIKRATGGVGGGKNVYFYSAYGSYTLYSDEDMTIPLTPNEELITTCLDNRVFLVYNCPDWTEKNYVALSSINDYGSSMYLNFTLHADQSYRYHMYK